MTTRREGPQVVLKTREQQQQKQQKVQQQQQQQREQRRNDSVAESPPAMSVLRVMLQMALCVSGIYVCFGVWSIKQERVITKPYRAVDGDATAESARLSTVFVIGLAQAAAGGLVSALLLLVEALYARRFTQQRSDAVPKTEARVTGGFNANVFRLTMVMGFTNAFGSSLGYAAMRRLPYPVVLATKMSKMVPVMLVGFFWHGTRYSLSKCAACGVITGGIICFYMLEEAQHPHRESRPVRGSGGMGFALLLLNLLMDGFTNSTQDVLVKRQRWGGNSLMLYTNIASGAWLALVLVALELLHPLAGVFLEVEEMSGAALSPTTLPLLPLLVSVDTFARWFLREVVPLGDFSRTYHFFQQYPEALHDVVVMSLLNAVGQFFIFRTISLFGTLTMTALTLLRKSGSVLLSILIHGHHVAAGQWVSLLLVFAGAVWEGLTHARRDTPSPTSKVKGSTTLTTTSKSKNTNGKGNGIHTSPPAVREEGATKKGASGGPPVAAR